MKLASRVSTICAAVLIAVASPSSFAALLLEDSVPGSAGPLVGTTPAVGGVWSAINPAADKIQIVSSSLVAPVGFQPSTGSKLSWGSSGEDARSSFALQNTGTVYYSFLLNLTANSISTGGTSIVSFGSGANLAASLGIRRQATGDTSKYNIGFYARQTFNGPQWAPDLLSPGTTYLVVLAYTFVAGTANDVISLWISPTSFGGSEPTATVTAVNASGDISGIDFVQLWQRDSSTPTNVELDELRVGTTWADVAPSGTVDVVTYPADCRDIRYKLSDGTRSILQEVGTLRPGQITGSLVGGVTAIQLPSLRGGDIISAKLQFQVTSNGAMTSTNNAQVNLEGIRSAPLGSPIVSTDYLGLGLNGATTIQNAIVKWDDGGLPRTYETDLAGSDALADWLVTQYNTIGAGGFAYLRLAPSQMVGAARQYTIPTGSIRLIITTSGSGGGTRGFGTTVSATVGAEEFSWTFDRPVEWGYFIDGQPWIVMPSTGNLNLTSASPARKNAQSVHLPNNVPVIADIDISVKNPPFDHVYNGVDYVDATEGVTGWDSRFGPGIDLESSPKYNPFIGWDGVQPLPLFAGDCITTAKSLVANPMPDRATPLKALAVLTVLNAIPPDDAFRPGVIRPATGPDRTNPEILRYSDLINITPAQLIASPVGSTDLRNVAVSSIESKYLFYRIRACLPGPGFINTGDSKTEGASALLNTYAYPPSTSSRAALVYGGDVGNYMGQLAIGSLAEWLTPEERKFCRIRLIQRAIDAYSAVKAGVCLEESAGILPGYSTLITTAGVLMNHAGMKSINQGVNGLKPHFIFADYATHFHLGDVPTADLPTLEAQADRRVSFYHPMGQIATPALNKKDVQPAAAAIDGTTGTLTMNPTFSWGVPRPIVNILNLKVRVTSGPGAGDTIYVITETVTSNVTDSEKFRKTNGTLYAGEANVANFVLGGKVRLKPAWQNGVPDSTSLVAFSVTTSDTNIPTVSEKVGEWYWQAGGISPTAIPTRADLGQANVSPRSEYAPIQSGGTIDNLIALYSLGQQNLYKGGLDKYLMNVGERAGYGEVLFDGDYLKALLGNSGNTRGALWKREVLTPLGKSFVFTGLGTSALEVPRPQAKMWYEP